MKRRNGKSLLTFLLCIALVASLLAGCGKKPEQETSAPAKTENQPTVAATTSPTGPAGPEPLTLPIVKDKITLKFFTSLDPKCATTIKSYNEMISFIEMEKRTNIHIDFIHPPVGQEKEQFNLLIAAQDYPDLFSWDWYTYPGGPEKALNDGIIISINDEIAKYAPNLTKIYNENPDIKKDTATDSQKFFQFPFMRYEKTQRYSDGFQIRKDWLDTLGLKSPTTMDEWHTVLTAFKQKDPNGNGKADEIPFISQKIPGLATFMNTWGMTYGFYQTDKKIYFGPAQPEYKEYLQTMRKWFQEGLIDSDFLTTDSKNFDAKVTSEVAGSYFGLLNGNMGKYTGLMMDKNPKFLLGQVAYPLAKDGKSYNFITGASRATPGSGDSISTKNKHVKESIKWLDYFYSEPGILLMNFGVEGVSYTMKNGEPQFTDLIMKNPDGLSVNEALSKHMPASVGVRLFQDPRYWSQVMAYENQREAMKILSTSSTERTLPLITATPEESQRLAAIMNEINTYKDEKFGKFVMGQEPIENFDKYINDLKSMGLDEAMKIQQAALDRYYKR